MSSLSRITYNSINIDFDRAFNQFMLSNVQNRAVGVTLAGTREQINFYAADRLKIAKRVLSRTFESQLAAFWEYVKSGQTFSFRWDRDLLAYMAFENLLATNDAVAGTFARTGVATYVRPSDGLVVSAATGTPRFQQGKFHLGVLLESAQTNILLRSEEFDNATWTKTTLTVTANVTATKDPMGGTAAESLVPSAATGEIRQDTSISIDAKDGVFTIYLKRGSSGATSATLKIIRADTGATLASQAVTVTKNWTRFEVIYISAGSIAANFGVIVTFSGSGETFYGFGADLKVGTGDLPRFASSYVQTTSAAATRNGDSLLYAASSIFDDEPTKGSVSFWYRPLFSATTGTGQKDLFVVLGVSGDYLTIQANNNIIQAVFSPKVGSNIVASSATLAFTANADFHICVTWDFDSGAQVYINGAASGSLASLSSYAPKRIGASVYVGSYSSPGSECSGTISDLEIRRDVLTAAEILARYNMAKPLGWRRNYWSSLMIDDDAYAPELLVGGYRWGMELNFVEQK